MLNHITKQNLEETSTMLDRTRRLVCDFIVAAHHGGAYLTDPDVKLDAFVEALEGLQVAQDTIVDAISGKWDEEARAEAEPAAAPVPPVSECEIDLELQGLGEHMGKASTDRSARACKLAIDSLRVFAGGDKTLEGLCKATLAGDVDAAGEIADHLEQMGRVKS